MKPITPTGNQKPHKTDVFARIRVFRFAFQAIALSIIGVALVGCNKLQAANFGGGQFGAFQAADDARNAATNVRKLCPGAKAEADAADQAAKDADAAAEKLHSAKQDADKAMKEYLAKQAAYDTAKNDPANHPSSDDYATYASAKEAKEKFENSMSGDPDYQKANEKMTNADAIVGFAKDAVNAATGFADQAKAQAALIAAQANAVKQDATMNARWPARGDVISKFMSAQSKFNDGADRIKAAEAEKDAAKKAFDGAKATADAASADVKAKTSAAKAATETALNACPQARATLNQLPPDSHSPGQDIHNSDNPSGHPGGSPIPSDPSNRVKVEPGDPY